MVRVAIVSAISIMIAISKCLCFHLITCHFWTSDRIIYLEISYTYRVSVGPTDLVTQPVSELLLTYYYSVPNNSNTEARPG